MTEMLKREILVSLLPMGGSPMPERTLFSAVRLMARPEPTLADFASALRGLETDGYVTGTTEDLVGRFWALTVKGRMKAAQL